MDYSQYLNQEITCKCGRVHRCDIKEIIIEEGAVNKVASWVKKEGFQNVCVIQDENTKKIAGDFVYEELRKENIVCGRITLAAEKLLPDEKSAGSILMKLPQNCDLLLAVGSGTINDLTKFVSFKLSLPYYIVGTAPSMDGYTSNVAAMITDNTKTTYAVNKPQMVFGDLAILKEAPMEMIAAGVGDIIGKYVCLVDWKLSHLITGEYYCEFIESIVRESIEKVKEAVKMIEGRDKESIGALMEALVLSGIAMSYAENSRPASGSEHHLSHFWEMMFLQSGEHGALHGTKVGIGTVMSLRLYEYLREINFYTREQNYCFDLEAWKKEMEMVYGKAAMPILSLEKETNKNSEEEVTKRLIVLKTKNEEVIDAMKMLPSSKEIAKILASLSAPYLPAQIQVSKEMLLNSIRYAKELRNRYGLLQLLYDIGRSGEFADRLADEMQENNLL